MKYEKTKGVMPFNELQLFELFIYLSLISILFYFIFYLMI